jgi:hypothetical protein
MPRIPDAQQWFALLGLGDRLQGPTGPRHRMEPYSLALRRDMPQQQEPGPYTPPVTDGLPGFAPSFDPRVRLEDLPEQGAGFFAPKRVQPIADRKRR